MALKQFNPITPGMRNLVLVDRSALHKGKPVKRLTEAADYVGRISVVSNSPKSRPRFGFSK